MSQKEFSPKAPYLLGRAIRLLAYSGFNVYKTTGTRSEKVWFMDYEELMGQVKVYKAKLKRKPF